MFNPAYAHKQVANALKYLKSDFMLQLAPFVHITAFDGLGSKEMFTAKVAKVRYGPPLPVMVRPDVNMLRPI